MKAAAWQPLAGDPFIETLLDGGIDVVGVVCQRTPARAGLVRFMGMSREGRAAFLRRAGGRLRGLVGRALVRRTGRSAPAARGRGGRIRRVNVKDHNGPECLAALEEMRPDVLLLRGTDIVRTPLIASAPVLPATFP
jgi:hypothetical protein